MSIGIVVCQRTSCLQHIINSIPVSLTESKTRFAAQASPETLRTFGPSLRTLTHVTGNIKMRSPARPNPTLSHHPTPRVTCLIARRPPWATCPNCPHHHHHPRARSLQEKTPTSLTNSVGMKSSLRRSASIGSTKACACSVVRRAIWPKSTPSWVLRQPRAAPWLWKCRSLPQWSL